MKKAPEAFRTISEVSDLLDTPAHVLRFWESKFYQIKPVKRAGGRRYYRPDDVALIGGIKVLLQEQGLTIRGVQRVLHEQGVKHVAGLSRPLAALGDPVDSIDAVDTVSAADANDKEIDPVRTAPIRPKVAPEVPIEDAEIIEQNDAPNGGPVASSPESGPEPGPYLAPAAAEPKPHPTLPDSTPAADRAPSVDPSVVTRDAVPPSLAPPPLDTPSLHQPTDPEQPPPVLETNTETVSEPSEPLSPPAPSPSEAPMNDEDLVAPAAEKPEIPPDLFAPTEAPHDTITGGDLRIARGLRLRPRGSLGRDLDTARALSRRIDALLERMSEASGAGRW